MYSKQLKAEYCSHTYLERAGIINNDIKQK